MPAPIPERTALYRLLSHGGADWAFRNCPSHSVCGETS